MIRAASLLAAALLAGCTGPAAKPRNEYAVPVDQAYAKLLAADLGDFRRIRQCGLLIHFNAAGVPNSHVTWRVVSSGVEVMQFTARLTAVGPDRTRVDVEIPSDPVGGEMYDGSQFYPWPALRAPTRAAIEEQVAATLEGRDFTLANIPRGPHDDHCGTQRSTLEEGLAPTGSEKPRLTAPGYAVSLRTGS